MSVLVIQLPPRPRTAEAPEAPAELAWVLSPDGHTVARQGRSTAAQLPRADSVCAVLADGDVAFHRITLPKAPPARLRAALAGVLEDQLLDDDAASHLALQPQAVGGQPAWVAVVHKPWLAALIQQLEQAGTPVDRVLPPAAPTATAQLHAVPAPAEGGAPRLVLSGPAGTWLLSAGGGLARQQLAQLDRDTTACTAHPAAVADAERWLERPVTVLADAERALQAARSDWNLRQFDLATRRRGSLALRDAWRQLASPAWRPVRGGLVALVAAQLLGLNAWAWTLDQRVQARRQAMVQLLQATHPQVRAVLDAPVQMQRETDALRSAAGRATDTDLEPLLAVAATAWPDGQGPLAAVRFESGRLSLSTPGWGLPQQQQFAERVRAAGYRAEAQGNSMVLTAGDRR